MKLGEESMFMNFLKIYQNFRFLSSPIIYIAYSMSKLTKWNQQMDDLLCFLREQKGISDWSLIADQLTKQIPEFCRNSRQCRQRYNNIARYKGENQEWSPYQLQLIAFLFISKGPRWIKIAEFIPGRSPNSIKNKLNAELRKTLRRFNSTPQDHLIRHRKPIKSEWFTKVSKIAFSDRSKSLDCRNQASKIIAELIEVVLIAKKQLSASQQEKVDQKLLERISEYNKNYLFLKGRSYRPRENETTKLITSRNNQQGEQADLPETIKQRDEAEFKIEAKMELRKLQLDSLDSRLEEPFKMSIGQNHRDQLRSIQDINIENSRQSFNGMQFNYFENSV